MKRPLFWHGCTHQYKRSQVVPNAWNIICKYMYKYMYSIHRYINIYRCINLSQCGGRVGGDEGVRWRRIKYINEAKELSLEAVQCICTVTTVHTVGTQQLQNFAHQFSFKGSVQRKLRPRLKYIIGMLFSRPIIAGHKIDILLKGHFTINKNPSSVSKAGSYHIVYIM